MLAAFGLPASARAGEVVQRLGGTLSAPASGDPEAIALRYVREHLPSLGLAAKDLDTLEAPTSRTAGGVTMLRWRQAVDGIPAADHELRVNVTRDGRVLSVLGSPASGLSADTTPALSAGEAVRAVQDDVGVYRSLPRASGPAGATKATRFADGTRAKLALQRSRLTWRVTYRASSDAVWDTFVDADTGKVLKRANLVKSATPVNVWRNYPGSAYGGTATSVDLSPWLSSTTQLLGPNVHAYADTNDVGAGTEVQPGAYDFIKVTNLSGCSEAKPCSWTPTLSGSWSVNLKQNAVQAFYLANRFHDHLAAAPINFTDHSFEGADRLRLETDDGAATGPDSTHHNNANMYTPPDGTSPVMQMYLWSGSGYRAMNGGDDASILYHEYTHGLSGRLIADADGVAALNLDQAGAMGEGWSDWYAKDFLVDEFPGLDDPAVNGDVHMGVYTDATPNTIRSQGLDCPVGATSGCSGYTYGDFGTIRGGPEVHYDGEIWAETLWDLRTAIGSENAERLITQGMRLTPAEPSFLDARNAILAADVAAGSTLQTALWTVFARRGMGYYATTTGSADDAPVEDFSPPPDLNGPRGTIAGRVTDVAGAPVPGARVTLGPLVAVAGADGRYSLAGVPAGTYANVLVTAPGYDRLLAPVTVVANTTATLDETLRRNWAARAGGATVTGSDEYADLGCGPLAAIDQNPDTTWSTDAAVGGKSMTVTLPATIAVDHFEVDPAAGCGDDAGASAKDVRIDTSPDGTTWTPAATRTFAGADRHRMNVVAPTAGASGVRYVRATILAPQSAGARYMDISEFGVYAGGPVATPTPTPTATATASPTVTATATASPTVTATATASPTVTATATASPTVTATATASPTATATASPLPTATATALPGPEPTPTALPAPAPTATPTPTASPTPSARPAFTLSASGKRAIRVKARCPRRCAVSAKLTVDTATARKLVLGKSRTAGSVKRTLKAGSTTFTVKLATRVRLTKVKRVKATLTVRSGSVVERRRVTINR